MKRAKPYQSEPQLATAIQVTWQVPPDQWRKVSDPAAAILERCLPERAKTVVEVGIEPVAALSQMYEIANGCAEREKALIASYGAWKTSGASGGAKAADGRESGPSVDPGAMAQDAAAMDMVGVG